MQVGGEHTAIIVRFIDNDVFLNVDMDLLLDLSRDARDMLQNIVESACLSTKEKIPDPTYYISKS